MSTSPSRSSQKIEPLTALTSSSLSELVKGHPTTQRLKMLAYLTGGGAKKEAPKAKPIAKKRNLQKPLPGTPIVTTKRPGTSGTEYVLLPLET